MTNDIDHLKSLVTQQFIYLICNEQTETYEKTIDELILANAKIAPLAVNGFLYRGCFYKSTYRQTVRPPKGQPYPALDTSLVAKMDKLMALKSETDSNKSLLERFFYLLFQECKSKQDIRDAVPDFLVVELRNKAVTSMHFMNLARVKPEGWSIINNPNALHYLNDKIIPMFSTQIMEQFLR